MRCLGGPDDVLGSVLGLREMDVTGVFFAGRERGWPSLLVELCLGLPLLGTDAAGDLQEVDQVPGGLARRGLVAAGTWLVPPEVDRVRYTLRRDRPGRPGGLYGPDGHGCAGAWCVMSPLPPWPPALDDMLPATGAQIGVYVTTRTENLVYAAEPGALGAGLAVEAAAGRLYGTRAAVLP